MVTLDNLVSIFIGGILSIILILYLLKPGDAFTFVAFNKQISISVSSVPESGG